MIYNFRMARFNKADLATRFYVDGKECLESADLLFHDKNRGNRSQHGILLIHGIELLLKSYLLIKNTGLPDDPVKIDSYLIRQLGHKYNDIYQECLKYGNELASPALAVHLNSLGNNYYADSVGVRYVQDSGLVLFHPEVFSTLEIRLAKPIHDLLFPTTEFDGKY
jgi:hypothetical protein